MRSKRVFYELGEGRTAVDSRVFHFADEVRG
jgi:hypothetical protein